MGYLIAYFLLGLFTIPWYYKQTKNIWQALSVTFFGFPIWPVLLAYTLWVGITTWNVYCIYCHKLFVSKNRDHDIIEHIKVCEKHPMRQEFERLDGENKLLRYKNDVSDKLITALYAELNDTIEGGKDGTTLHI